jgi:hypothetical protein
MKATVDDLKRYAFCPKLFEQQGSLKSPHDKSARDFTLLLTFLFRRDMETGIKQNWNAVEKRWRKIYCMSNGALTNSSVHATEVYNHQIIGEIPALLTQGEELSLIMTEPVTDPPAVKISPAVRYLSMALGEEFPIKTVHNATLIDYQVFHVETFQPNSRYWEVAMLDFVNIMQAMQNSLTYPNTLACTVCPIQMTCEVLKGNA